MIDQILLRLIYKDELGDYNSKRDTSGYASEFEFMPNQTLDLEKSAEAKHAKLKLINLLDIYIIYQ